MKYYSIKTKGPEGEEWEPAFPDPVVAFEEFEEDMGNMLPEDYAKCGIVSGVASDGVRVFCVTDLSRSRHFGSAVEPSRELAVKAIERINDWWDKEWDVPEQNVEMTSI